MQSSQLVDIANKIDANFINGCRLGSGINGSAIIEDDFTTHFTSLYTVPWMNVVLKADGNMPDLTQRVKDVLSKFQVPMTWRLGPLSTATDTIKETLQSLGLVESTWQEPGMRLDLEKFKRSEPLPGLRIETVNSDQQIEDWLVPFAEGFSVPPDVLGHFRTYGRERVATNAGEKWFVGYYNDAPAACAQYSIAEGINMIYSICTTGEFRKKGIARRMVDHTIVESLAFKELPVCLYSSAMGLSLYESIGFVTVFKRTDYFYTPDGN